jgi:hypothetical protein
MEKIIALFIMGIGAGILYKYRNRIPKWLAVSIIIFYTVLFFGGFYWACSQ